MLFTLLDIHKNTLHFRAFPLYPIRWYQLSNIQYNASATILSVPATNIIAIYCKPGV